jgi:PAS domain S-box-containing protein
MSPRKRTSITSRPLSVRTASRLAATLVLLGTPAMVFAVPDPKLVVVIYPHECDGAPGTVLANRGIRSTFAGQRFGPIEIRNEYVDAARLGDAEFMRTQTAMLRQKYAGRKVDLVMAGLSSGLDFALSIRDDVFPAVPIVYIAVDQDEAAVRRLPADVIGAPVRVDLTGTLDVALRLQPDIRRVFVVSGSSDFDRKWEEQTRKEFGAYEDRLEIVYLAGLPMDDLLQRVADLPAHSAIYYLHIFKDGAGDHFIPAEALERLAAAANAPVYTNVDTFVDRGAVGGHVYSFETEGTMAARLALRILSGEQPATIQIPQSSANLYLFNGRQLNRWNISEDRLPAGSVIRFKEPTFWDLYRWHVIGVLSLFMVESVLIAVLLFQRMRRRRAEAALRESEARFRLMADAAPVLIWMSGADKKATYCNRPWLNFTGQPLALGAELADCVHPDDRARCLDTHASAFHRREPFAIEYRLRRHDGEYRWVLDHGSPHFTAEGQLAGFIGACTDITEGRQAQDELLASQGELRRLTGRLIEAQEAERRRVARELHDDLSQGLALLSIELGLIASRPPESTAELVDRVQALSAQIRELSTAVHDLSHQLHPSKLDHLGLDAALRGLCNEVGHHYGLKVRYTASVQAEAIRGASAVCLYRIAQEALRNVVKHAQTEEVRIELTGGGTQLFLRISDDGVGFNPALRGDTGLGLISMRERLALVGGRINIESRPGAGTQIEVTVPLPKTDTNGPADINSISSDEELVTASVNTEELP